MTDATGGRPGVAFDDAACALARDEEIGGAALAVLLGSCQRVIRSVGVAPSDCEEVAAQAISHFVAACIRGSVEVDGAPAYLTTVARNAAADWLRRTGRRSTVGLRDDTPDRSDDGIARLVDDHANARDIERLFAAAARSGDTTATRVMNEYLALAGETGRSPGTRAVASACGVSHITVQRVLARLRHQLERP